MEKLPDLVRIFLRQLDIEHDGVRIIDLLLLFDLLLVELLDQVGDVAEQESAEHG